MASGAAARAGASPAAGLVATPEAISRSGRAFRPLSLDSATEARMEAQLDSAEAAYEANPDDPEALIWVGRRLAYMGRYQEAIEAFSEGIDRHPTDARFYRHRGHRFITVRDFGRAVEDLELAVRLVTGERDVVEPDGQPNALGIPRSTLQTNIWYHLGLARYLLGDFNGAAHAYHRGYQLSRNDDMRVAMADWLWISLMRLGREEEAAELLASIRPNMKILENEAYHRRLLMYAGRLSPDSLFPGAARWTAVAAAGAADPGAATAGAPTAGEGDAVDPLALATYGYGLGAYHLIRGDRVRSRALFQAVRSTGYWPAFGYIAAEAELIRMGTIPVPDTAVVDVVRGGGG